MQMVRCNQSYLVVWEDGGKGPMRLSCPLAKMAIG